MGKKCRIVVMSLCLVGFAALGVHAQQTPPSGNSPNPNQGQIQQLRQDIQTLRQQGEQLRTQLQQIMAQAKPIKEQLETIKEKIRADREQIERLRGGHHEHHGPWGQNGGQSQTPSQQAPSSTTPQQK